MTDSKQERALRKLERRLRKEARNPDPFIDGYYRYLRTRPQGLSAKQQAALKVQEQTIARKDDPPSPEIGIEGNVGHFADPTVKISFMLPPMKGKDE
jgi:hypothetical protein